MRSSLVRFALVIAAAALIAGCSAESKKARVLGRAAEHYKKGDFEKARIEYQNVLQTHPNDPTANERLALIWHDRGATVRALAYLSKMTTLAPGNMDLRLKRAQLMLSLGRAAEAKKEALLIIGRSTAVSEALVLLTETVREPEDFTAADQILQKFREKNTVSFQIASANLLIHRGDAAGARAALQKAISIDPKSAAAHVAMAGLYVAQNDPVQAAAEYKIAADLSPIRSMERLKQAGFLAQTGAVPAAIAALNEITRQAPDFQGAWRSLAQIAIFEKRYDDALALLQNIFTRDPSDYEALILRSRVTLAKGETKKTIEDLQSLGKAFPGIGAEKYHLALAHLQNNDKENALSALQQAVGQNPYHVEANLLLAQFNLQGGAPQQAAAAMAALVTRRPDLLQAHLLLIEASKALGKLEDLAGIINTNVTRNPKNAQLHYVLGLIYNQQQKSAEARRSFEKALELSPNVLPTIIELVNLDLKDGKPAAALQRAQALVTKAPKLPLAHYLVARAHATQGNWSEVEGPAIETINLDANNSNAYGLLVESFTARRQQPEVVARMDAFLASHSNQLLAILMGGQVYTQLSQFTKARDLYEKYLSAQPASSLILNNLASLYSDQLNQPDRALELAQKARELDPTSPAVADTLGWILYQRKSYKEALPLLEESAKKLPANPEVQFHFGMVNQMLGHHEAALAALRIAAATPVNSPGRDEAKRQLAQVEKLVAAKAKQP